ncbi:hypothetical protein HDF22_003708 [Mucilaginibacter lappiensis]|uniref:Uncharacterized protein n=1 Tax=Mucilaginibacter lappiensis TaxID=354630 RepID=A0A841JF80_9SPHI|nr:hypothetical protein [Mucilaginibacter lappiensis]
MYSESKYLYNVISIELGWREDEGEREILYNKQSECRIRFLLVPRSK